MPKNLLTPSDLIIREIKDALIAIIVSPYQKYRPDTIRVTLKELIANLEGRIRKLLSREEWKQFIINNYPELQLRLNRQVSGDQRLYKVITEVDGRTAQRLCHEHMRIVRIHDFVYDLSISNRRIRNAFARAGVLTIADLVVFTKAGLQNISGIGPEFARRIETAVNDYGFELNMDPRPYEKASRYPHGLSLDSSDYQNNIS